ncbi:hypothetical protein D4764_10G0007420 [Takifugu flavidus]|uniref:Uncharacterized protein n=1 Tax=Takifugu flavidus TaxID=433684 RepID=A0A5C6PIR2_9TELE|nr:hypothetical protein D4764_10G0007420 [Takifugu flavidus]
MWSQHLSVLPRGGETGGRLLRHVTVKGELRFSGHLGLFDDEGPSPTLHLSGGDQLPPSEGGMNSAESESGGHVNGIGAAELLEAFWSSRFTERTGAGVSGGPTLPPHLDSFLKDSSAQGGGFRAWPGSDLSCCYDLEAPTGSCDTPQ